MRLHKYLMTLLIVLGMAATTSVNWAAADWKEINGAILESVKSLQPPIGPYTLTIDYKTGGKITLIGQVNSETDKTRIERIARTTREVTSVSNELKVVPTVSDSANDNKALSANSKEVSDALATRLVNVNYQVAVDEVNNTLVLRGKVDSDATRQKVLEIAKSVGRLPVVDKLEVVEPRPDTQVMALVEAEVKKQFPALSEKVKVVGVNSGVVTVSGDMKDHWDIDRVLAAIVMVDGVRDVKSEITIEGVAYNSRGSIPSKK